MKSFAEQCVSNRDQSSTLRGKYDIRFTQQRILSNKYLIDNCYTAPAKPETTFNTFTRIDRCAHHSKSRSLGGILWFKFQCAGRG